MASTFCPTPVQALETQLKAHLSAPAPDTKNPTTPRFQKCLTTQEVFSQHRGTCLGLTYNRIPVPDFCAPREEVRGQTSGGPDLSSSSLAWEKQLNSIMGPGDCLMGSTCGLRKMFPSLCVCVHACMQAHVPIHCVFYLPMLCVVGPVCVSYVAGMCTMCYREGSVVTCLLEGYMIHGSLVVWGVGSHGVHGVCLVFVGWVEMVYLWWGLMEKALWNLAV